MCVVVIASGGRGVSQHRRPPTPTLSTKDREREGGRKEEDEGWLFKVATQVRFIERVLCLCYAMFVCVCDCACGNVCNC